MYLKEYQRAKQNERKTSLRRNHLDPIASEMKDRVDERTRLYRLPYYSVVIIISIL